MDGGQCRWGMGVIGISFFQRRKSKVLGSFSSFGKWKIRGGGAGLKT